MGKRSSAGVHRPQVKQSINTSHFKINDPVRLHNCSLNFLGFPLEINHLDCTYQQWQSSHRDRMLIVIRSPSNAAAKKLKTLWNQHTRKIWKYKIKFNEALHPLIFWQLSLDADQDNGIITEWRARSSRWKSNQAESLPNCNWNLKPSAGVKLAKTKTKPE